MVRCGIQHIHANLASKLALRYVEELNRKRDETEKITLIADSWVECLLCATEDELAPLSDSERMYLMLRSRAHRSSGIEVKASNLASPYGTFSGLSFHLLPGERLMVVGENGSGKSTLLKMLLGILSPKDGSITLDGKSPGHLARRTIGYIPQSADSASYALSVNEVVGLGQEKKNQKEIDAALTRVGALSLKKRSYATLSGGEKQKVSLARCLLQKAKLLLFDEPTASLDGKSREMVKEILSSLSLSETPTLIIVTHDPSLVAMKGWKLLHLGESHA